ncbi:MAG: 2-hydroxy-acid oxidase, partial [Oscillospiraceae bacterium]|nr:2-hydroxy-acid oxidase [Oscillospiraceae bacterium]
RNKVAEFILYTHEIAAQLGVRIPSFGHAGDGNLHIYICRDALSEEAFADVLHKAFSAMYTRAAQLGGLVSGEHGIGWAKKQYLHAQYGDVPMQLMRGIKAVFDEKGILNPDKIL